ncbi:MAG: hypothetical protein KC766_14290 [Myxococcales bacterium]|nr:hypothetical protein [Myxococcales bacterium]
MTGLRTRVLGGVALAALCIGSVGNLLAEPKDTSKAAPPPGRIAPTRHLEPHPLSSARARIDAQRRLFTRVEQAITGNDFPEARRLLDLHAAEFGGADAWKDWRTGYQRVVDCLDRPTDESRAAGQRFVDEQRGSRLRRRVRRACLP